jgi:hypothetical protein
MRRDTQLGLHDCNIDRLLSIFGQWANHNDGVTDELHQVFIAGQNRNLMA